MTAESKHVTLPIRLRAAFRSGLPIPLQTERHLGEALATTLQRHGSLVRAELAFEVAEVYGFTEEVCLQLGIAIEYFHTASLLFDDLPSMDNASDRRGAACIHHLFGEGPAILAALGLINRAYSLLWKAVSAAAPTNAAAALAYLERYLGLGGLLNGQSQDLHYADLPAAQRSPQRVAMGKTVSLIRLPLVLPALAGGADAHTVRLLDRLAVFWGLTYQGLDDLKDILHETDRAGKTAGRDRLLHRPNLALALGPAAAMRRLDSMVATAGRLVDLLQSREVALCCLHANRVRLEREVAAMAGDLLAGAR